MFYAILIANVRLYSIKKMVSSYSCNICTNYIESNSSIFETKQNNFF